MVLFNYSTRELTAKIVYYGPGLCGKTTNLQYVYSSLPDTVKKGKMLSLATKTDRTLFFDFLPIELGTIRGMRTRIQLYTVPGQVFYNSTRKLVLKGADGVVFVADSQSKMLDADVESYKNLEQNLREMGLRLDEIPLVMQFNKRDLPGLSSIEEMNTRINRHNAPFYEAVAMTGIGVEDTLKAITKLVLNNLSAKYRLDEGATMASGAKEAPAAIPFATAGATASSRTDPPARSESPARRASDHPHRATAPPEDRALDALDSAGLGESDDEEVIDLVDEVPAEEPVQVEPITLDDEILEEIDEEPVRIAGRPEPVRETPHRPPLLPVPTPGPRAVVASGALAIESDPLEEDPIDLGDPLEDEEPAVPQAVSAGSLRPGQEREIEVPMRVEIDGRTLTIQLRLKIRLS